MSRCKTEQECLYQPWCKINGKCYSASARKNEAKCCCAGFFTESGYCPVHGPVDSGAKREGP